MLLETLSEPARSHRLSTPLLSESFGYLEMTSIIQIECDLEET
jgi:hypothetical protein